MFEEGANEENRSYLLTLTHGVPDTGTVALAVATAVCSHPRTTNLSIPVPCAYVFPDTKDLNSE